ncbi:exonuclease, partial [Xanthomonas campestris pv. cannae]|nr:exonuclease [Xanthomonas campestris pv. cannae]
MSISLERLRALRRQAGDASAERTPASSGNPTAADAPRASRTDAVATTPTHAPRQATAQPGEVASHTAPPAA